MFVLVIKTEKDHACSLTEWVKSLKIYMTDEEGIDGQTV